MDEAAHLQIPLGIVIERRDIDNPWLDYTWRPVAVIPGAAPVDEWRCIGAGEGWRQYHAKTLTLELFRGETEGYLSNLSQPVPAVFIVLRPGEEAGEHDVEPFHVTACPYEAMGYTEDGEEIVEGVAMPPEIIAMVQAFIDRHHVEEPFRKRKNKRHRVRDDGRRPDPRIATAARYWKADGK